MRYAGFVIADILDDLYIKLKFWKAKVNQEKTIFVINCANMNTLHDSENG